MVEGKRFTHGIASNVNCYRSALVRHDGNMKSDSPCKTTAADVGTLACDSVVEVVVMVVGNKE